jgi:hypothetical protein
MTPADLIQGYLENALSQAERDALQAWLAEDDTHLDKLVLQSFLDIQLREVLGEQALRKDSLRAAMSDSEAFSDAPCSADPLAVDGENGRRTVSSHPPISPSPHPSCAGTAARSPRSSVLGFLHALLRAGRERPMTSVLTWLVMAIVCSGMVLTLFLCIVLVFQGLHGHLDAPQVAGNNADGESGGAPSALGRGDGENGSRTVSSRPPISPSPHPSHSGTVARLIHISEPRWAVGSHSPHVGDDLEPGRKLLLLSGLAEIMFESGVRAVLQGPATMEIGSSRSALLQHGKLTVRVEDPDAHGFEVRAPGMKYTDLGTEFGVSVAKDGTQEMVVFRGQVKVEASADGQIGRWGDGETGKTVAHPVSPSPHPAISPSSLVLSAHQAVRVAAPDKPPERIAADEKQFVRSGQMAKIVAESSPEFIRWTKFSEELNKRPDLVAHYDFQPDESDRTVLRNRAETGRQYDGKLVGGAEWCEGSLPGKQALAFVAPGSGVRVSILADCKQMTLVARAKPAPLGHEWKRAILVSDDWQARAGAVHWQFDSQEKSFRLGISPGSSAANVVRSAESFRWADAVNQWGFYAETFDASTAEGTAYFNGRPVAKDRARKPHTARIGRAMIGRFASSDPREKDLERVFCGQIDELMIFNSVLGAEEISRLYKQ